MEGSTETLEGSVRDLGALLLERSLINPNQLWALIKDLESRKGTPRERSLVQLLAENGMVADAALKSLRRDAGAGARCTGCGRTFQIEYCKPSLEYRCKNCGGKLELSRGDDQTLVVGPKSVPSSLDMTVGSAKTVTVSPQAKPEAPFPPPEATIVVAPGSDSTMLDMSPASAMTVKTPPPPASREPKDASAEGTILMAPGSDPTMLDMSPASAMTVKTPPPAANREPKDASAEGTILMAPGSDPTMLDLGVGGGKAAPPPAPSGPTPPADLYKTNPTIMLAPKSPAGSQDPSQSDAGTLVVSPDQDPALEKTVQAPHISRPGPKAPIAPSLPPDVEEAKKDPKRTFGKYIIVRELGRGGQAVVYKAWDTSLAQNVALKIIRLQAEEDGSSQGTSSETDEVRTFQREAQMAARLRHPNIVRIYELGCIDSRHYLTMEMVEGPTLFEQIHGGKQRNTLTTFQSDPEKLLTIMRDVARAVHYAHSQTPPVIHRDLKPHNVLLTLDGMPCVADFGLAKEIDVGRSETMTGVVKGTPSYMAPEQAEGRSKETDQRTDVYSLGAILYEILTGRPPFTGDSVRQVLNQIVVKLPERPNDVIARTWQEAQNQQSQSSTTVGQTTHGAFKTRKRKGPPLVARQLETICLKAIEKRKIDRYQSAKDLASDIDRFLQHLEIEAREPGLLRKAMRKMRAHPIITGSAAAILLCGGVGAAALDYARRHQKGSIDLLITNASDNRKARKWLALQLDIENLKKADPNNPRIAEFEAAYKEHLADMARREALWTEELKKFRAAPSKTALEGLRTLFRGAGDLKDFRDGLERVHLNIQAEAINQARDLIGPGADPRWLDEKVRQPARTCRALIDHLLGLAADADFAFKSDETLRTWRNGLERLLTYEGTWALRVNVNPFAEVILTHNGKEVAREFTPWGLRELEVGKGYQIEICWPSRENPKQRATKPIDSLRHGAAVVVTGDMSKADIRVMQVNP